MSALELFVAALIVLLVIVLFFIPICWISMVIYDELIDERFRKWLKRRKEEGEKE